MWASPAGMTLRTSLNVADEEVLTADGKVDPAKLDAIAFDEYQSGYYAMGEKVATAWDAGTKLMK